MTWMAGALCVAGLLVGAEEARAGSSREAAPDPARAAAVADPEGTPAADPEEASLEDPDASDAPDALPPRLLTDVMVIGGVTAFHSLAYWDVRNSLRREASLGEVWRNLGDPFRRAVEGAREDDDPFLTNYVAHPLSWGMLGLYLKERGYSNGSALLFSQVHSMAWEYVIEGSYQKPSGKDLITNAMSSAVAIYWLHDVSERAARTRRKGLHHRVLTAFNPLRPMRPMLHPGGDAATTRVEPIASRDGVGIRITLSR